MLRVELFGTPRIWYGDRELPAFPTRAAGSLFAFLVLNRRRRHHRDVLAGTFWGDRPDRVARKNLRTDLWRIRTTLREGDGSLDRCLVVDDQRVGFELGAGGSLDVEEFEGRLESARRMADIDRDAAYVHLEAAIALFRGGVLDGVYEEWCLNEQERLRTLYLEALERAVRYHAEAGDPRRAIVFATRLLNEDPLREHIHRELMQLHYAAGDRAAAVRQFRVCADLLERELGVEPMAATQAMKARLLEEAAEEGRSAGAPRPVHDRKMSPTDQAAEELRLAGVHLFEAIRLLDDRAGAIAGSPPARLDDRSLRRT